MIFSNVQHSSLLQAFFPKIDTNLLRKALIVIAGSLALTISAKINLFLGPVPFTMQTYVVMVLAVLLGARLASASVILYIAEGLAGLPVFAAGGGIAYLFAPSFGFIIGFLAATMFIGYLTQRGAGRTLLSSFVIMSIGHALLFVFGLAWLAGEFGIEKAYWIGLHPFWLMSVVKTVLAALTVAAAWRLQARLARKRA
ncbi:MAG: biotin transporter BioY [Burkholderiales bacterium]|jgi:biotin transport system substrate-specific component|nr:biotin transporter BioY [Burkholderiales bacterium]